MTGYSTRQIARWLGSAADLLEQLHYDPDLFIVTDLQHRICGACQVGALHLAVNDIELPATDLQYVDVTDPRIVACCAALHPDALPEAVWSPHFQEGRYHGSGHQVIGHLRGTAAKLERAA